MESQKAHAYHDALAKRFLGDKEILSHILKGCVPEFREMAVEEIVGCIGSDPAIGTKPLSPGAAPDDAFIAG